MLLQYWELQFTFLDGIETHIISCIGQSCSRAALICVHPMQISPHLNQVFTWHFRFRNSALQCLQPLPHFPVRMWGLFSSDKLNQTIIGLQEKKKNCHGTLLCDFINLNLCSVSGKQHGEMYLPLLSPHLHIPRIWGLGWAGWLTLPVAPSMFESSLGMFPTCACPALHLAEDQEKLKDYVTHLLCG